MYAAVKGIYENGKLTLLEPAPTLNRQEVLVTFLNETLNTTTRKQRSPGGLLRLDHLKGKSISIPDDFNEPLDLN